MQRILFLFLLLTGAAFGGSVTCTNTSGDAAAIQSAANSGGTVTITGTCNVGSATFNVPVANTTITGTATLNSTSSSYLFNVGVNGVTFNGLTLNGAGVQLTQTVQTTGFTFTNMTVEYTHGNKREAAAFLRISRSTLYRILANEQARKN